MENALFEFHPKDKPYALIIGVFNEGDKFTRQLEALQPYRQFVDIIIADGNSSDGATSPEGLRNKVSALLVNKEEQRGLSVQYRMALKFAYDRGYEGFIMMDGNGKDGVDAIPRFIEKLQEGFDFIQGSRFMPGGIHKNTPLIRILGMRLVFNPFMYIASGFAYTDAMNGFKACNRSFLEDSRIQPFRKIFVRYNLQYFFNYIAGKCNFRVIEVPVARVYIKDKLPHSKIVGYKAYFSILLELLNTITGRYTP